MVAIAAFLAAAAVVSWAGSAVEGASSYRKNGLHIRGATVTVESVAIIPRGGGDGDVEGADVGKDTRDVRDKLRRLGREMKGRVFFADDRGFDKASACWRGDLPQPWAVAEARTEDDVALAVPLLASIQKEHGTRFCVKSGGHHYIGHSSSVAGGGGGICLSLSKLNHIEVDIPPPGDQTRNPTATFGPGTRGIDVFEKVLQKHSHGAVLGACPSVAEGGFLLGGGFSYISRQEGLGCDNVEQITAVLASGELVTCSPTQHPDLFWAMRGAGSAGFGVVTKYKYRLFELQDTQLFGSGMLSLEQATEFVQMIGSKDECTFPRNAGAVLFLFPAEYGDTWLGLLSRYETTMPGLKDARVESEEMLDRFGLKDAFTFKEESWTQHTRSSGMGDGKLFRVWNGFLDRNSKQVWTGLLKDLQAIRDEGQYICIEILAWGGKISDVKSDETAFPWRSSLYNIAVNLAVPQTMEGAKEIFESRSRAVDKLWSKLRWKYGLKGSFYNYPMEALSAKEFGRMYWGSNLKRLRRIKTKYDPQNVFCHPQSIPPL